MRGRCLQRDGFELRHQEKLNFIVNISNLFEILTLKQILENVSVLKSVNSYTIVIV